ncbi:hypothetical protein [Aquirufa nivalisilvae]|uniref:hypothetical protein n=1 Tax=Aquirufa nivalisilvae TaxID=2516557 RepID=UPI001032C12D|nr:hypothetical protein [Aquirufa nivalisilvae]TBH76250.1 hypothetical protein EWU22_01505 [Aquirufa nivalisilvae]
MSTNKINTENLSDERAWPTWQLVAFRIAFVFFISMTIPNRIDWYKDLFTFDYLNLHYRDLYDIARFGSGINFFGNKIFGSTLQGYAIWVITFIFSVVIAIIWSIVSYVRKSEVKHYDTLFYWLNVVVRYRAAIGIIGFGFTKLTPTQLPYPSWGLLNTDFGDLTLQKIYWLSIGIVPLYEVFTGIVEVLAGALLFFRKTVFWGAVLLFGALADIVYVNFAYDGGVHVYSSYFVLFSAFLLLPYIPKIYGLLIQEKLTLPFIQTPSLTKKWQETGRIILKYSTIIIFLPVFTYLSIVNFIYDPYKQPSIKGLSQLRGNYHVTSFRLNNQEIPYSPLDTTRWQQATFEKWTTLTFKVNKPVELDLSNGGGAPMRDISRTFELTGVAGGQRVFYYEADTVQQVLYLQDKNLGNRNQENEGFALTNEKSKKKGAEKRINKEAKNESWIPENARKNIGDEIYKIDPIAWTNRRIKGIKAEKKRNPKREKLVLHYDVQQGGNRVILSGINAQKDSIYVVLDRYSKNYALSISTLESGKYD